MDIAPVVSVLDFEIYVLVAMKLGMINREVRMEAKLAGDGFTMRDAEAIAERVAQALGDESTFFNGPTHGLAADASVSVQEFADRFGPATLNYSSTLSEKVLPAHEHYKFEWNGEQYGAGFSWGLFLFAARLWPED
ncbi:hypothetical protein [Mycobacteroides abscessus]|uniref:Uncharacterized protein n=1 Tax=Mycobacteroides abscessus MAB_030201_1075 TaxID=1335410 RepID=A0A829PIS8_9MYCO|nr:hypothetical protein [Mycobacteroides abscessus]ETZ87340.1 hypothetical protein L829_0883 [Mycobacteroides abscessus MAB_030201_1075]EIC64388.1 hypothetical protein OUW_16597 [Mycobacteroides abscessus M93]MDM2017627.1 hypothetical protein [Mycobacteroides abscessus]MDM2021623.1 hypothetical protein [Mycobacteroides abscessus]MDM2026267.1 hypothetical protein [Mycobacteroides abscessus]